MTTTLNWPIGRHWIRRYAGRSTSRLSYSGAGARKILAAIRGLRRNPSDSRDLIELVRLELSSGHVALAKGYAAAACAILPDDHALNLELAQLELHCQWVQDFV